MSFKKILLTCGITYGSYALYKYYSKQYSTGTDSFPTILNIVESHYGPKWNSVLNDDKTLWIILGNDEKPRHGIKSTNCINFSKKVKGIVISIDPSNSWWNIRRENLIRYNKSAESYDYTQHDYNNVIIVCERPQASLDSLVKKFKDAVLLHMVYDCQTFSYGHTIDQRFLKSSGSVQYISDTNDTRLSFVLYNVYHYY